MNVKRTGTFIAALLTSVTILGAAPAIAQAHPLGPAAAAHVATTQDSQVNGEITRSEVLVRSRTWVDEHVMYSQNGPWYTNQYGTFRRDCSGFVSMAWHLNTALTTASLPTVMDAIGWGDLKPGDALWRRNNGVGHVALFLGWNDDAKTQPIVREEYTDGQPAVERPWTTQSYIRSFTPMRYHNIVDDLGEPEKLGEEGIAASASYRYGNQEHLFFRGTDGALQHTFNNGEEIGTETVTADGANAELVGEPVAYVAGNQQHVFAQLSGNRLGHWFWNPTDADPTFEVAATDIDGKPTGYVFENQLHVYARGTDGKLKHLYWTPDNDDVVEETLDQDIAGDPVAYVWGDQQHVFGRTPSGELGHWYWLVTDNEPTFGTWGDTKIAGNPAGYAFADQQHVFARGTDGKLMHFYWMLDTGVVEEPLGEPMQGDPVAYVHNDEHHVFVRTPGNTVEHLFWTPEDNEPQRETWEGDLGTNPTGFSTDYQLNIYGRSTDGTVTHWYLNNDMAAPDVEAWGA